MIEYVVGVLTIFAFIAAYAYALVVEQRSLERFIVNTIEVAGRYHTSSLIHYVAVHTKANHETIIDTIHHLNEQKKVIICGPEVVSKSTWIEE